MDSPGHDTLRPTDRRDLIELGSGALAIELGHRLERGMPNHVSHPPYAISPYLRHGDFELPGGYSGANEMIVMSGHSGTHLDAFSHVGCRGRLFGGAATADAYRSGGLMTEHTADTVSPLISRGVLLDVAGHRGVERLEPAEGIGAAELAEIAAEAGVSIHPGDCVLVRTGHGQLWSDPERYLDESRGLPGLQLDAAEWLADQEVAAIGSDTPVVERSEPGSHDLPVHLLLLAERGVYLIENLELEALHADGAVEFLFLCLPLPLAGSTGSPVRPLALLERE